MKSVDRLFYYKIDLFVTIPWTIAIGSSLSNLERGKDRFFENRITGNATLSSRGLHKRTDIKPGTYIGIYIYVN